MSVKWLPNALTVLRIAAAPVVGLLVFKTLSADTLQQKELYATLSFTIFAVAAVTDWLDGFLARALNASSELGAKLDLWADKILVFAVLVGALPFLPILATFGLICLSIRDIFVMRLRARRPDVNLKATFLAKSKTAIVMGGMALAMLGYALATGDLAQADASLAEKMMLAARIGLSIFVFGSVLSLGTGWQYFAEAAKSGAGAEQIDR